MTLFTDAMSVAPFYVLSAEVRRGSRHEIAHVPRHREPSEGHGGATGQHRGEARVLGDRAPGGRAAEGAEELYAGIDPRGGPPRLAGCRSRHERRELGFKNVEPREEDDERGEDRG